MTPEEYVGRIRELAIEGLDREALDFAARNEAAVEGSFTAEQDASLFSCLESAAMMIDLQEAAERHKVATV